MDEGRLSRLQAQLRSQTPLLGAWQRRRAASALAEDGSPAAVTVLAHAIAAGDEPEAALVDAARALRDPIGIDALAAVWVATGHTALASLLREQSDAGRPPSDPSVRAALAFVGERWDDYEREDFTGQLLPAGYVTAGKALRREILRVARAAGRMEVVALADRRRSRRTEDLSAAEWDTVAAVLVASERWDEIWRLVQAAPPVHGRRLLLALGQDPAHRSAPATAELIRLAAACPGAEPPLGALTRPLATLTGHARHVSAVAMSPDGHLLASAANDRTVRLWRLPEGEPLAELVGHSDNVLGVTFTPDGAHLVSHSADHTLRLWHLPDGAETAVLRGHGNVVSATAVTPDGRLLASGSWDGSVRLWSLPDGRPSATLSGHQREVAALAVTPDGRWLISGAYDNSVRLWSLPDGRPTATLNGHTSWVRTLAVSADGALLASAADDNTIRLWSLPDGAAKAVMSGHANWVRALAITADASQVVSGSWDDMVRLWHLPGGEPAALLAGHTGWIRAVRVSAGGGLLATASNDNTARLWRLPDGQALATLDGHTLAVYDVAVASDETVLATASSDATVRLWASAARALAHRPLREAGAADYELLGRYRRTPHLTPAEQAWLEFLAALHEVRLRYAIGVEETLIAAGEFDIELDAAPAETTS